MISISVDRFLNWAFVHELAKGGGEQGSAGFSSAWSALNRVEALGVHITAGPRASDFGGFAQEEPPHPDALIAGEAVRALGRLVIDLPADWGPCGDWLAGHASAQAPALGPLEYGGLINAACARARARMAALDARHVVALVVSRAVLALPPDWHAEPPRALPELDANGRPAWFVREQVETATGGVRSIEVYGHDPRTGRQRPGAYRKYRLDPDPAADILARADYQIWRAAMDIIWADLADGRHGELVNHRVLPCTAALAPWDGGDAARAPQIFSAA